MAEYFFDALIREGSPTPFVERGWKIVSETEEGVRLSISSDEAALDDFRKIASSDPSMKASLSYYSKDGSVVGLGFSFQGETSFERYEGVRAKEFFAANVKGGRIGYGRNEDQQ